MKLPFYIPLLFSFGVFLLTLGVWQLGLFEQAELWVYDRFILASADPFHATDDRFLLVLVQETDLQKLDYPLRDKVLSNLLETIESGNPNVVGLDIYRDLPEPRDGSENAALVKTFTSHDNIIGIFRFGTEAKPFLIPPPPCLKDDLTRFGFNDFPFDDQKAVRRAFLYIPNSQQYVSLSMWLAQYYLASQNIVAGADGKAVKIGKTTFTRFQDNDGAYINATAGGYQFFQDFKGPFNFKTLSIADTLNLKDTSIFKDKIVIVGVEAESLRDKLSTPFTEQVPGPVQHAQVVNQILRAALNGEKPLVGAGPRVKWPYCLVCCLIGSYLGIWLRCYRKFSGAVTLGVVAIIYLGWLLFQEGYWMPNAAPAVAFILSATLVKAYVANLEEMQRTTLMRLFSQHVSPEIAQEIWSRRESFVKGGRPQADRLTATILFTDLKNFSTISENMTPDELILWLNECLSGLAQYVGKNGGIVNKYIGDAIMAIFGVPTPRTNTADIQKDAINAVRCAVCMVEELDRLNAMWKSQGRHEVGLRIGVYTGELMAGVLGSDDRLEYTVIGDSVNTASRLESFDKDVGMSGNSRILVGGNTYQYIKDLFETELIGTVYLKGKAQMVEVYKVCGLKKEQVVNE